MSATEVRRGGVVFRAGEQHWFLPATVAGRIESMPALTAVPGAPADLAGLAHVGGEIVPVLALRPGAVPAPGAVVLCSHLGERVALAVDAIAHTGAVDVDPRGDGSVRWSGGRARAFDLAGLCARLHGGAWAGVSSRP
jgi:chemotaxis signal transduction protein